MGNRLVYFRNAERPATKMWLFDDDETLIDFSGYSFRFRIGNPGKASLLTKTSNITGAAGAGVEPTGTPNVVVTWSAGELDIEPGTYRWQLTCTTSSLDRVFQGTIKIEDEID